MSSNNITLETPSASTSRSLSPAESTSTSDFTSSPKNVGRLSTRKSLQRNVSDVDVLSHPLLSSPPSGNLAGHTNIEGSNGGYAVYTGRRKPNIAKATEAHSPAESSNIVTSISPVSPSTPPVLSHPAHPPPIVSRPSNSKFGPTSLSQRPIQRSVSEAKEKLLGQNLKADVQALGLHHESTGAAMIQKLSTLGYEAGWTPILSGVTSSNITLLLPSENLASSSTLSPAFFLDHLALLDTPVASTSTSSDSNDRPIATLSGLRGTFTDDLLTFTSCGTAIVETSTGLLKPGSLSTVSLDWSNPELQRALLGEVPAHSLKIASPGISKSPCLVRVVTASTELSIPRSPTASTSSMVSRVTAGSRLAALFARPNTPDLQASPPSSSVVPSAEDKGKIVDADHSNGSSTAKSTLPSVRIKVMVIDKILRYSDIQKGIVDALDSTLRSSLREFDGFKDDSVIIDRVCSMATMFRPPPAWSSSFPPRKGSTEDAKTSSLENTFSQSIEDVSYAYQDLLSDVRTGMVHNFHAKGNFSMGADDAKQTDQMTLDQSVDGSLEQLEELLTTILYDRLFSPATSGDAQEDENLASRIAALNILELSLEHLGLDLVKVSSLDESGTLRKPVKESLEDIIESAGKELALLQQPSNRCPRAKLAIFVNVHKVIVEGLTELPPIPLKDQPEALLDNKPHEVEMDDAMSRKLVQSGQEDVLVPSMQVDGDSLMESLSSSVHDLGVPSAVPPFATSHSSTPPSSVFDSTSMTVPIASGASSTSADLILPLLIYAIVQYNPRIASHLKFVQRFRAESLMRGEASYCATNIQAAIEFLSTVDISSLGLSSTKVLSTIGDRSSLLSSTSSNTRKRASNMTQDLDQFVDTANHTLVNVVDSSYKVLFGRNGFAPRTIGEVKNALDGAGSVASRARGQLMRRSSSQAPSVASLSRDASVENDTRRLLPVKERSNSSLGGQQREMKNIIAPPGGTPLAPDSPPSPSSEILMTGEEHPTLSPHLNQFEKEKEVDDGKSIRSISSLLRESSLGKSIAAVGDKRESSHLVNNGDVAFVDETRSSFGDRIASLPGLGFRFVGGGNSSGDGGSKSTRGVGSTKPTFGSNTGASTPARGSLVPATKLNTSPAPIQIAQKFMDCQADDLKVGEVNTLLSEYKRLAEAYSELLLQTSLYPETQNAASLLK